MPGDGLTIAGWNKLSLIDFPGTLATVLFFSGCNLRCPYCHNPGVVRGEYPAVPWPLIEAYLTKRHGTIEGVVLSGGEPTIQPALPQLVTGIRRLGLKIKLDTNGLLPEVIEQCAPDYLALDVKTLPRRYKELGYARDDAPALLARSIAIVKSLGERAEIRITAAPRFIDEPVIGALANMVAGVARVWIQPYRCDVEVLEPGFSLNPPYPSQRIEGFMKLMEGHVGRCLIRDA
jgi:pyruvate formate lyase activating enzyme